MSSIQITIERFVIDGAGRLLDPEHGRRLLDDALATLAERLRGGPFERWRTDGALQIAAITLGDVSIDAILGPNGAQALADALYQDLVRRLS
ncbi:MAG TPA: hypothetical protein VNM90_01335 [Haliangium sp.]|nr:hypothetical protein [Haliangium sp.]